MIMYIEKDTLLIFFYSTQPLIFTADRKDCGKYPKMHLMKTHTKKKKKKKTRKSLKDPSKHKHINICMGPRRRKERQNGVENLFNDIRTGNFPSLRKETDMQV